METTHKQIVLGILAHVDSGKTTLSEAMLYRSGSRAGCLWCQGVQGVAG